MRWVIVSAGPITPSDKKAVLPGDSIVACDAGWQNCRALGLVPKLIVGDFDSSPQPQSDGETIVLPHVKDDSDTQYAAREVLRRGAKEVTMLGALGGKRIEHALANIATALWLEKHGVRTQLIDAKSRITFVAPGEKRTYQKGAYFYLSVFSTEGIATGVEIEGAAYPLHEATLETAYPIGVSNEFACDTIRVASKTGYLTVIETIADT